MKTYIVSIISVICLFCSCAGELDQYSHSSIPPESVTEKDLPALRNGMYYIMQNSPKVRSYIMFDMLGGVLQTGASSSYNDLINSILSPLNSYVWEGWSGYYGALFQVNDVLAVTARFPNSEISQRTRGEAFYFRAYIYYCLATRWGDVPVIRENTLDKVSRDPLSEVWKFIEENLEEAIGLLGTSTNYYYVSKDAVIALNARVKLSQGKNDEAAGLAEGLITSNKYRLDSFEKIFRKQTNTEIIFAFESRTEESGINVSDLFYTYAHPNKGQGSYRPTEETIALFANEDKRKAISLVDVQGTICINKYPSGQTGRDPLIISRIAELYLISAEAQGRVNGLGRLNELRAFRGLSAISLPATNNDYIKLILDERRRELLGENFIYYDLIRTGLAMEQLGILEHQQLLPIPGRELQRNSNLEPNPGY